MLEKFLAEETDDRMDFSPSLSSHDRLVIHQVGSKDLAHLYMLNKQSIMDDLEN